MDGRLEYPKKILCTPEYLLIFNSGGNELWQCNYKGGIIHIYSDFKEPLGMVCEDNLLYAAECESKELICIDLHVKKQIPVAGTAREKYLFLASKSDVGVCEEQVWFIEKESSMLGCMENTMEHTYIAGEDDLLCNPESLVCGVVGDGCGGGRLFIADTGNNRVIAYDPQSGRTIMLMENLHNPCGIGKKGCELFIADTDTHQILCFNLSLMKADIFLM